jgi:hypothetical protein
MGTVIVSKGPSRSTSQEMIRPVSVIGLTNPPYVVGPGPVVIAEVCLHDTNAVKLVV